MVGCNHFWGDAVCLRCGTQRDPSCAPGSRDVIVPPGTSDDRALALIRGILEDHQDVVRRNDRLVAEAAKHGLVITYDSDITSPHYGEVLSVASIARDRAGDH